jgi:hypothetical protein
VGLHHRANSCAVCMKGIRGLHGKDRITTNGSCTRRHAEQKTATQLGVPPRSQRRPASIPLNPLQSARNWW